MSNALQIAMLVQRENANDASLKAKGFAQKGGVCALQQLLLFFSVVRGKNS